MNILKAGVAGSVVALWLTFSGCSSLPVNGQEAAQDVDTCNSSLVDDLAFNDAHERLLAGRNFEPHIFQHKDEGEELKDFSEIIANYKEMRTKNLNTLFGCRDDNKVLHGYANKMYEAPSDHDTFKKMMVTLASERMDDVKALYPVEHFVEATTEWTNYFFEENSLQLQQLQIPLKDDVLAERLRGAVEENYEHLAILAMETELADTFNIGARAEHGLKEVLKDNMSLLIKEEMIEYVNELQEEQRKRGPIHTI